MAVLGFGSVFRIVREPQSNQDTQRRQEARIHNREPKRTMRDRDRGGLATLVLSYAVRARGAWQSQRARS